jgi:soluble lytic murein transglycosylase-like protein
VSGAGFGAALASVSPDQPKIQAKQEVKDLPARLPELPQDALASLKIELPEQKAPTYPLRSLPEPAEPPAPQGVKSPTLLEVRRVQIPVPETTGATRTDRINAVKELVQEAGARHAVDPTLSLAVVKAESNFDPKAVSSDGHASKGLFQLLDTTGQDLRVRLGMKEEYDPFNPSMNVELGVSYLRYLHNLFSSSTKITDRHSTQPAADSASLEKLAVAAFNAGEGRVASAQARAERAGKDPSLYENVMPFLPPSTREYVTRVMTSKREFNS